MNPFGLKLLELSAWDQLRTLTGTASEIPTALGELAASQGEEDSRDAYWRLDNHIVVQGQLFPSAVAAIPILLAMLVGPLSYWARVRTLDLLLQIGGGTTDESESRFERDLGLEAREALVSAIWTLYGIALEDDRRLAETALELCSTVNPDREQMAVILAALAASDLVVSPFARELLANLNLS